MNLDNVIFKGRINEVLDMSGDVKKFQEDSIICKKSPIEASMIYEGDLARIFIRPSTGDGKIEEINSDLSFEGFSMNNTNQTAKFYFNEKKFIIYATKEKYQERWQYDFEEDFKK
jgi:hypothetical protein